MANLNKHCKDCKDILGKEYGHVHIWLDFYARIFTLRPYSDYHRTFRHNSYGLKVVEEIWGKWAMEAAKIHLVRDIDEFWPKDFDIFDYKNVIGEALKYFNNMENMEPSLLGPVGKRMFDDNIGVVALANEFEKISGKEGIW